MDVGSTTTDLVPFSGGQVNARGYSDHGRVEREEVVYTGLCEHPSWPSGVWRFLARRLAERLQRPHLTFKGFFRPASGGGGGFDVGDCAPAAAVASLAAADVPG
jgi:hypothetical protein